jgi:hypothetical protein
MDGKLRLVAVAALMAVAAASPARAADRGDVVIDLGTTRPGADAVLGFDIAFRNPNDPNAKPPQITAATYRLPEGTSIASAATPQCRASNDQIQAQGPGACPADSRVGGGTLTAVTGFGPPADPAQTDVTLFNGPGQLIEVVTFAGTDQTAGVDRLTITGSTLTAHPPSTPGGPPDGQTTIRDIRTRLDRPGYVTSPPTCARGAGWPYSASFEFGDGGRAEIAHTLPCTAAAPRLGLSNVVPRRARVGRRTTFRFAAASTDPACVRGAKLRFAGRRAHTNARGIARVTTTLRRPGAYPLSVSHRGCRAARGAVTAVR